MPKILESRIIHETIMLFEDGEVIFAEGDSSRDLFIIQEGAVEIYKITKFGELKLATFIRGKFFGDMALLQGGSRFAAAKAKGVKKLLSVSLVGFF